MFSVVATEDDVLEHGLTDDDLGEDILEDEVVTDKDEEFVDRGVHVLKALLLRLSTNLY